MITIEQLLESVDFEPRWVTKDKDGTVYLWGDKPVMLCGFWGARNPGKENMCSVGKLKLSEFKGKDWTECIYEVPRKVDYSKWIGKLCRFWDDGPTIKIGTIYGILTGFDDSDRPFERDNLDYWFKHCEPVLPDDDVIYKGE